MKAGILAIAAGAVWGAGTIALKATMSSFATVPALAFLFCGAAGFALFQGGLKFGNATEANAFMTAPLILIPLLYGTLAGGEALSALETAGIACMTAGTLMLILRRGRSSRTS